jgi:hypothetical protein
MLSWDQIEHNRQVTPVMFCKRCDCTISLHSDEGCKCKDRHIGRTHHIWGCLCTRRVEEFEQHPDFAYG